MMRRTVLLCFGLAWAGVDIPVHPNLKPYQLSGKWYPILTAKGDPAKRPFKAFRLEPFLDEDLIMNVEIPQGKNCTLKEFVLNQIRPGVFRTEGGKTTMHVIETDYDTYQIVHYVSGNLTLLHLNGRGKKLPEKEQQKFDGWVKKLGFNPDWSFALDEEDLCSRPPKAP